MDFHRLLPSLLLLASATVSGSDAQRQRFECTKGSTCHSLVGYKPINGTTIGSIRRFFGVENLRSLLGANNLPLSTSPNHPIGAQQLVKIPIPCICFNGTGASNKMPVYTVQKDDGLFYIANTVFGGLVEYPRIQAVNKIEDANIIFVGQKLWIPLPCSCEDVDGEKVVHYGQVVEEGSSVEEIAHEFGTTSTTLYEVNGIDSDRELIAGKAIDIPLRACTSSMTNATSPDYPLLLANGTYALTAGNCVRCKCDAANNWRLHCDPSGLKPSDWATCPAMRCSGADGLSLGNTTGTSCSTTTCAYAGFSRDQRIFTTLATESTCPSGTPNPGNYASRTSFSWEWLLVFFHLILLCANIM
uniref:LysM domain-containing protein n=1 Tax=Rhizophora mucronata TaxID=61149 RepID=A0A2P2P0D1_RHIMU